MLIYCSYGNKNLLYHDRGQQPMMYHQKIFIRLQIHKAKAHIGTLVLFFKGIQLVLSLKVLIRLMENHVNNQVA